MFIAFAEFSIRFVWITNDQKKTNHIKWLPGRSDGGERRRTITDNGVNAQKKANGSGISFYYSLHFASFLNNIHFVTNISKLKYSKRLNFSWKCVSNCMTH